MGRKKRSFLSDDSSEDDSDDNYEEEEIGDADARAERELHEDPYQQRKRRRLNNRRKDDATYGIFGGEDDDEGPIYKQAALKRKAKTPVFQRSTAHAPSTKNTNLPKNEDSMKEDSSEDISGSSIDDDSSIASNASRTGEAEDLDLDNGGEQAMDGEEDEEPEMPMHRGGIGNRGGVGSARAGLGMSFAPATPVSQEALDPSLRTGTPNLNTRGGIGSQSRMTFAPSSRSNQKFLSEDTARQEPPPPSVAETTATEDAAQTVGASPTAPPFPASETPADVASAFTARTPRAFVRSSEPTEPVVAPVQLSYEERAHFAKISGGFGARMMAKMGWEAGKGLGVQGQGIIAPVESKLRPKQNMGIAFGGFKERTKQAISEDKRKGKKISDDEDEKPRRKGHGHGRSNAPGDGERSGAWKKKSKPKKVVVEHKTYEEIVQEAGLETSIPHQPGIGPIIDATGATPKEVSSIAALSASWTNSTDTMRIPEIRHNLRLMVDMTQQDVLGLAREGKLLEEKRKKSAKKEARLGKKIKEEAELIRRLGDMKIAIDELAGVAKSTQESLKVQDYTDYETNVSHKSSTLDLLSQFVERFTRDFPSEYELYRVDEVLVGAMAPILRLELAGWNPLDEPDRWTSVLKRWKDALKMSARDEEVEELALSTFYGVSANKKPINQEVQAMTPWEALLWNAWLPKVRSAINNEWDPANPAPAVTLYEAWYDLIPPFIQDNILDQLILPKVRRAVSAWKPASGADAKLAPSLQSLVFPWLPHVGLRMEEFLEDTRRKVRSAFRAVDISRGIPEDLMVWKQTFDQAQWDDLILKYIVPKLGATLRDDFRINPRKQDMTPLNWVLEWFTKKAIRGSIMSQLMEREFFPKWLDVLHIWLTQPRPGYEEIAQWYSFWREELPPAVQELEGVLRGFERGQDLINEALNLDDNERVHLPKPTSQNRPSASGVTAPAKQPRTHETIREMVESYAAVHDVLFMPVGMVHLISRLPMYRITGRKDGKGGVIVYFQDDVVWAVEGGTENGTPKAVSFEEMVLLASKGR